MDESLDTNKPLQSVCSMALHAMLDTLAVKIRLKKNPWETLLKSFTSSLMDNELLYGDTTGRNTGPYKSLGMTSHKYNF